MVHCGLSFITMDQLLVLGLVPALLPIPVSGHHFLDVGLSHGHDHYMVDWLLA